MLTFKVSSASEVGSIAGAIADAISRKEEVALISIGAAAINKAIKGTIRAGEFLRITGETLVMEPSFLVVIFDDGPRTAVKLLVYDKNRKENINNKLKVG